MALCNVTNPHKGVSVLTWVLTGADFTGDWVLIPHFADKSVHVYGTFNTGNVQIEGSNEAGAPANPAVLRDPQGSALSAIAATTLKAILENPLKIRALGTSGLTSVTVVIVCYTPWN